MLRQKLYSAGLLVYCTLSSFGNFQKGSNTSSRSLATNNAMVNNATVSKSNIVTLSGFDVNSTALQFAKDYVKENSADLRKIKTVGKSQLGIINSVFSKFDIPRELTYMAIVESELNADQVCAGTGATGIWQLMPGTASELGLKVTDSIDERLQVHKSSTAAAKYLKQLHGQFGDWLLAIAAYNSGPAKVTRAINLSGSHSFWQLRNFLPTETRNYVNKFISMVYFFEGKAHE